MEDKITKEKLIKYFSLTSKALEEVKKNIIPGKGEGAKEIIEMTTNYLSDAKHFEEKEDYVSAFGALNYAHGWLDSGVRLRIFDVRDNSLFTVV
jgi:hypothetical protein|tara:strand:+ start:1020 stop:1301 length:282 start_codon:yes stop_codon:yes gene_type:complete